MRIDGHIVAGAAAEARPGALTFEAGKIAAITDADHGASVPNRWIVPGFIDCHTHPLEAGLELLYPNLRDVTTVGDLLAAIAAPIREGRERNVLLAFNLDPEALREQRYPDRHELDRISDKVPILVYRVDGHSGVVNSAGLALLAGQDAAGIERTPDGMPTGVMRGLAYEAASRAFKRRLRQDFLRLAFKRAGEAAAAAGVTTLGAFIGDEALTRDRWSVLLNSLSSMAVSTVPYLQTWRPHVAVDFGLKQVGGCLLIDGSFGSRTAALREAYTDALGNSGMSYVTDDRLLAFLREADGLGLQTAVHAIGDRAVEQVVRCHEKLDGSGNPRRHRLEHAELLDGDLIARIAGRSLVVGVQPAFEAFWGGPDRLYARRLGGRWQRTNAFCSLLDAGVVLGGSSDAPITPAAPLAGIKAAMAHPNPAERVSGEQAMTMFTTSAAFALGLEQRIGSLDPGKDADFVVLTGDPRTDMPCEVVATFRAGKWVYRNPRPELAQLSDESQISAN